ncbi:MAG: hypothetical protein JJU06_06950 [Ectothiorhodospiraceae bacterium]|nr:hypothetical protein [Ectothiorhodospiraceae bacterium]
MNGRLIGNRPLADGGRLVQIHAVGVAGAVAPGHWFQLRVGSLAWPVAVLDASSKENWIAFHLPPEASEIIADAGYGTPATLEGPLGTPLAAPPAGRRSLLLCDAAGVSVALFAARRQQPDLVLAEVRDPPPVRIRPSRFIIPGSPPGTIAGIGPLEEAGIPSRIACPDGAHGCLEGSLEALLQAWLEQRSARQRWETAVALVGNDGFVRRMSAATRGQFGQTSTHPLPEAMPTG